MSEEKNIQKGKIKDIKDAKFIDKNGNLGFWITFEEAPSVQGLLMLRPETYLKVGDEIFYTQETIHRDNKPDYVRFRRAQDPSKAQQGGFNRGSRQYSEDPYIKCLTMCLSYANTLAAEGKIDPSKVLAVANDYTMWVWSKIDERKK